MKKIGSDNFWLIASAVALGAAIYLFFINRPLTIKIIDMIKEAFQ
jgi:hypothetical protein